MMKILVACEESQTVTKELRKLGHEAYSCDILPCSGGHNEWHIQNDVLPLLNGNCSFKTVDNVLHNIIGKWDMILAFPPCTHIAVSGAAWFERKRADGRQREGIEFFCKFLEIDCPKVVIENPAGIISGDYVKKWFPDIAERYSLPKPYTQTINPYEYGDPYEKRTCLWIKGLPNLLPTNIVEPEPRLVHKSGKSKPRWYAEAFKLPPEERARVRSKTFPGIAKAMAEQWAGKGEK